METPARDGSMHIRVAAGQLLVSRETALAICRLIVTDLYGEDEYRAQAPLGIEDGENVWIIRGSRVLRPNATAADRGPVQMSISKLDGAIVSFTL